MVHRNRSGYHRAATVLAIASAMALMVAGADARPGKGGNFGSRGTRTDVAPPMTQTAPRQSQPIPGAQTPRAANAAPAAAAATPSRWGSGLMAGLAGGLLGAGLFGLLSGSGLFGGLGSLMGFLGLMLQLALVFFVVRFLFRYFRRRQGEPATAGAPAHFARQPIQPDWQPAPASRMQAAAPAPVAMPPLDLVEADFGTFERLLGEIQDAYGRGDRVSLTQRVTPEMANLFNGELSEMARQGVINRISDVKLLQGDLAEAWREPGSEYATVAMRYAIIDVKTDKATGRLLEGDPNRVQEVVENWTFVRREGDSHRDWLLSAIQQA